MTQRTLAPTLAELATQLRAARRSAVAVPSLTSRVAGLTVDQAYQVQRALIAADLEAGRRRVGHKMGMTSRAMQLQIGIREPDFGVLLDDMVLESGCEIDTSALIAPRLESEIAVVLQRDLAGPDVSREQAADAVAYAVAVLEITDSRIAAWDVRLADTIADNASSALVVVNDIPSTIAPEHLDQERVVLSCDGVEVASGQGSALLGHPLEALRWLANRLARYGARLRAGDIVLAGSVHASIPLLAGSHYAAVYASGLTVQLTAV